MLGQSEGVWKIKIAAAPEKGKANKELVDYLGEVLAVKKSQISLILGETSHHKVLQIEGLTAEAVIDRLEKAVNKPKTG